MDKLSTIHTMTLDGGVACLDLVNSGYDRQPGIITERLQDYRDVLTLCERVALLDTKPLMPLVTSAAAKETLIKIWQARELLYHLFTNPKDANLAAINALFAEALTFRNLQATFI